MLDFNYVKKEIIKYEKLLLKTKDEAQKAVIYMKLSELFKNCQKTCDNEMAILLDSVVKSI